MIKPEPQGACCKPFDVERMLYIFCLQHWFPLSDPGAYESLSHSRVVSIGSGREPVLDEAMILKFRQLEVQSGRTVFLH